MNAEKNFPKKFGRPTKFQPEFSHTAFELLTDPNFVCTKRYLAAHFGVSPNTLYQWMHTYPHFQDSLTRGIAIQEVQFINRLFYGKGNPRGVLTLLKVLHGWREREKAISTSQVDYVQEIRDREEFAATHRARRAT